jgi:hypothetical protein
LNSIMVQKYKSRSQFEIPYSLLCPVFFLRYPNPLATHVLSVDVLSREIISRLVKDSKGKEKELNILKTSRLILKKGTLPKWAPSGVIRNAESWVLEESEVDLDQMEENAGPSSSGGYGRVMNTWTRNLDHTTVLAVTERNIFREVKPGQTTGEDDRIVKVKTSFEVTSGISFGLLRNRIEKFGLNRVLTHVDNVSLGLQIDFINILY